MALQDRQCYTRDRWKAKESKGRQKTDHMLGMKDNMNYQTKD